MKKAAIAAAVCLVIVLAIIGVKLFALQHDPTAAYFAAEDAVKEQLKAPATADFPMVWADGVKVAAADNGYRVTAWVDAQNSFGAKLRTRWVCDVKKLSAGVWVRDGSCVFADEAGLAREPAPARPAPPSAR